MDVPAKPLGHVAETTRAATHRCRALVMPFMVDVLRYPQTSWGVWSRTAGLCGEIWEALEAKVGMGWAVLPVTTAVCAHGTKSGSPLEPSSGIPLAHCLLASGLPTEEDVSRPLDADEDCIRPLLQVG